MMEFQSDGIDGMSQVDTISGLDVTKLLWLANFLDPALAERLRDIDICQGKSGALSDISEGSLPLWWHLLFCLLYLLDRFVYNDAGDAVLIFQLAGFPKNARDQHQ